MTRNIIKDERAVSWVLGVAVICILLMPVVYFPLDYAWDQVEATITGGYTFTGATANALMVVEIIINYICVFGLIFTVNWAIVQAKSRGYQP
jgi:hypothetical protein